MSIYRKPTFVGQYIPWLSFCPKSQKLSLISCPVFRAFKICSDATLDNESKSIRKTFGSLGYPFDIVDKTIKKTISNLDRPKLFGPKKCPVYPRHPFLGNVANFLEDKVKYIVGSTYGAITLRIAHLTKNLWMESPRTLLPSNKNTMLFTTLNVTVIVTMLGERHRDSTFVGTNMSLNSGETGW